MKYKAREFCKAIHCALLHECEQPVYCKAYFFHDYLKNEGYEILKIRPFTAWAAEQIEQDILRNDERGEGPWETQSEQCLISKIGDEYDNVLNAICDCCTEESRTPERIKHLQYKLTGLAVTAMMLSTKIDPEMSKLRRGYMEGEKG